MCVMVVLSAQAACMGVRHTERPSLIGESYGWVLGYGSMYGGDIESWALERRALAMKNWQVAIEMMPTAGSKKTPVFSIDVRISAPAETNYSYDLKETYVRIADGDWQRAKVLDMRSVPLGRHPFTRDYYCRVPEFSGSGKLAKLSAESFGLSLDMPLFVDADPPPPGVPFSIRFAGLLLEGRPVPVPEIEFSFRK